MSHSRPVWHHLKYKQNTFFSTPMFILRSVQLIYAQIFNYKVNSIIIAVLCWKSQTHKEYPAQKIQCYSSRVVWCQIHIQFSNHSCLNWRWNGTPAWLKRNIGYIQYINLDLFKDSHLFTVSSRNKLKLTISNCSLS